MSIRIQRENWKGTYVYVARNNGKLITYIKQKNTKLRKTQLQERFKLQNTFKSGVRIQRERLTNVIEVRETTQSSADRKRVTPIKQPRKQALYEVSGTIGNKLIVARSSYEDTNKRDTAWESFFERVAQSQGDEYSADDGMKYINKIRNIREGWVYYAQT